jgi:hypothetical protein
MIINTRRELSQSLPNPLQSPLTKGDTCSVTAKMNFFTVSGGGLKITFQAMSHIKRGDVSSVKKQRIDTTPAGNLPGLVSTIIWDCSPHGMWLGKLPEAEWLRVLPMWRCSNAGLAPWDDRPQDVI